jgi:hypothetical protein
VPESLHLLEDNGFSVHSANTTHTQVTLVRYDGVVVYSKVQPVLRKLRDAPGAPPPVFGAACVAPACKEWVQPAF